MIEKMCCYYFLLGHLKARLSIRTPFARMKSLALADYAPSPFEVSLGFLRLLEFWKKVSWTMTMI